MNLFCGIDPSLKGNAVVIINEDGKIFIEQLISTHVECYINADQRLLDIIDPVMNCLLTAEGLHSVFIEGLSYMSPSPTLFERCGLLYLITTGLFREDIPYTIVPPTSLKKFASGNGRAQKPEMIEAVNKRWNQSITDDNICDAYSLAQMALSRRNYKNG